MLISKRRATAFFSFLNRTIAAMSFSVKSCFAWQTALPLKTLAPSAMTPSSSTLLPIFFVMSSIFALKSSSELSPDKVVSAGPNNWILAYASDRDGGELGQYLEIVQTSDIRLRRYIPDDMALPRLYEPRISPSNFESTAFAASSSTSLHLSLSLSNMEIRTIPQRYKRQTYLRGMSCSISA